MINTNKKIEIFDDTSNGDSFNVSEILYQNDEIVLCKVINEWYENDITVMIFKENGTVISKELFFYYAKNI